MKQQPYSCFPAHLSSHSFESFWFDGCQHADKISTTLHADMAHSAATLADTLDDFLGDTTHHAQAQRARVSVKDVEKTVQPGSTDYTDAAQPTIFFNQDRFGAITG